MSDKAGNKKDKDGRPSIVSNNPEKKKLYFNQYTPKSLENLGLNDDELKICGFMVYQFKCGKSNMTWLPLSSDLLRTILGGNYNKVITSLIDKNVLELFVHESGASYSAVKHYCKSYRFEQPYRDELYSQKFNKTRTSTQKVYFDKKKKTELVNVNKESELKQDEGVSKLLEMYKDVSLLDEWQTKLWGAENIIDAALEDSHKINLLADKGFAVQIGSGSISISTKNTGRLFHPAILMRRDLRPFLRYKGEKVATIDVKAAHPMFLGRFASEDEKQLWLSECNTGNIYTRFVSDKTDRDMVKEAFQLAISYSPQGKGKLAMSIVKFIEEEYPSIYGWLESQWSNCEINGKYLHTPQFILQSLEAKIFVKETFNKLADKFWMLPQHDGFLVEQENADKLIRHLNKVALKELGYTLTITTK